VFITIKDRISKISENLTKGEALLITSSPSRQYTTGFKSSAGMVVITSDNAIFLIDSRYYEKALSTVKSCEVILAKKVYEQLKEILIKEKIETLYTETSYISLEEYNNLSAKLNPVTISTDNKLNNLLLELRSIKDKEEIAFIRYSQELTDKTFEYILNFIKEGKTERETALEMEFYMRKQGAEGIAFDFIVVSGKNSSLPHGVPTDKPFCKGDFVTMDFGGIFGGYCSDMTRTVAIGDVTEEQKKVYKTVLKAQEKGLETIKAGVSGDAADKSARDIIIKAGYGEYFGHALGHSVGLEIHESPNCSPNCNTTLQSGTVMTVEPGIYIPNKFGVRIEDMVVVTEKGNNNLTKSPKELIIL